jgi:hypothetical protein
VSAPKVIIAGDDVRLLCLIEKGSLPLTFEWTKNGLPLKLDNAIRINSLIEQTSLLSFSPMRATDSGNYSCNARNKGGSDSFHIQIAVKGLYLNYNCKQND